MCGPLVNSIKTSGLLEDSKKEHKIVISRVLGRNHDLNLLLKTNEALDTDGKKVDLASLMDEEQQLDILQKLCTEQDFAWLVSDKCWIRERWSYFLPIVSKEEIESCFYDQNDSSSKLQKLQDKQERLFDAIVRLNG